VRKCQLVRMQLGLNRERGVDGLRKQGAQLYRDGLVTTAPTTSRATMHAL
jgi:hypothetical protein